MLSYNERGRLENETEGGAESAEDDRIFKSKAIPAILEGSREQVKVDVLLTDIY